MPRAASPRSASSRRSSRKTRARLGRPCPPQPLRVARTEGSLVIDEDGKEHIDLYMGWCVGNLGWGHEVVREAVRHYDGPDYVAPAYEHRAWDDLAALLGEMVPGNLGRCFRATGGTEAVEFALQAAMLRTKRHKFLSLDGSYHGDSLATLAIGSGADGPLRRVLRGSRKLKPPLDERAISRVETALRGRDVAAVVIEPIVTSLGCVVPDEAFMEGLQRLCRRYGTLLVIDEVATGFGRTGRMFGAEHYRIEPDIVTLAKALTGGYAAMGATLMTEDVAKRVASDLSAYSTFGWHPLSVQAAHANVRHLDAHRERILRNVEERGDQFRERLGKMPFPEGAEVRGKGLAIGVEIGDAKLGERLVRRCRERGVLLSHSEGVLSVFPALTIDGATAERALDVLEACVRGRRSAPPSSS